MTQHWENLCVIDDQVETRCLLNVLAGENMLVQIVGCKSVSCHYTVSTCADQVGHVTKLRRYVCA